MTTGIILCGGSGTRLWPLSSTEKPKQFIKIGSDFTLFQLTVLRLKALSEDDEIFIVSNQNYLEIIKDQLNELEIQKYKIVLEPEGRNTGPAILSTLINFVKEKDKKIVIVPSDHYIDTDDEFCKAINEAISMADAKSICLVGIEPSRPETGYGYISVEETTGIPKVVSFYEKPSFEMAKKFVESTNCLWNSGIIISSAATILKTANKTANALINKCQKLKTIKLDDRVYKYSDEYKVLPHDPIDTILLERAISVGCIVFCLRAKFKWADLGDWKEFYKKLPHDKESNALIGNVESIGTKKSIVISNEMNVSVVGMNNVAVIEDNNSLLVLNLEMAQDVKKIQLKNNAQKKQSMTVARPWGWYTILNLGPTYKIKKITVTPGSSISLQYHIHRAEHWIVVSGKAHIIIGKEVMLLDVGESVYVPKNMVHRITNNESNNLEIIEIQQGEIVEEEDIIRIDDIYGRS